MVSQHLVGIALQQLVPGAVSLAKFSSPNVGVADAAAGMVLAPALHFLKSRFSDHSARITTAIEGATDRAWRALELVLAGDSLWDRMKGVLIAGDMKAFRHDVRGLLAAAGVDGGYPVDRRAAARELRAARAAGLLGASGLTPAGMVDSIGVFARFDDPAELAAGQWRAADAVAKDLTTQGYPALAAVAGFRPPGSGLPLLGVAIRYFFRRAVESDSELANGLTFARLEGLAESQQNRFEALDRLITDQAEKLDAALDALAVEVAEVKAVALDIRAEQHKLGDQNRQIMEAVLAMQAKLEQVGRAAVRPRDSLSIRTDAERELVKKVIAQYRGLPEESRKERPALRNAVGMLEVAAGEFANARSDFAAVAEAVADPTAKAAAHMNAYRAALEARDWSGALQELLAAARSDGRRYAPFLMGKYVPQKILGAGGFGVAFLCKHKYMDARVVVKTLTAEGADFDAVFTEARAASGVSHPGIVRVTDCGYVEAASKDRPFVVMDYFPGLALDEYVRAKGPIATDHLVPLARNLAEALGAAHEKGILHRDVKPGNVLVKWAGDVFESRVIDFGLAVRHRVTRGDTSNTRSSKTLVGESLAGTLDYAAPEQMGRVAAKVAPYSDIYGWAKTCCFALFQTSQPTLRHWQGIPPTLATLLGRCLEDDPKQRPQSFAEVIAELEAYSEVVPVIDAVPVSEREEPATRRRKWDDDNDDDGRPARRLRRDRDQVSGFPLWAGALVGLAVVVTVVILTVALRKKSPEGDPPDQFAQNNGNNGNTGNNSGGGQGAPIPPGGGSGTPQGGTPGNWIPQGGVPVGGGGLPKDPPSGGKVDSGTAPPVTPPPVTPPPAPRLPPELGESTATGGTGGNHEYREFRQDGATLVGFDLGFGKAFATEVVAYLRPIYRTPSGKEEYGTAYGKLSGSVVTAKAKDGYALGGIVTSGGGQLTGICFTFMRIGADGLDKNDWLVSDWYGEARRKPGTLAAMRGGDGARAVGIHGKRFDDGGSEGGAIGTVGLVVVPIKTITVGGTPGAAPASELPAGWRASKAPGGIFAKKDFRDLRTDGSILIGLEVGTDTGVLNRENISYLRPIYQTPAGEEEFGAGIGKKATNLVTLKAKDGYAVAAITVAGGGGMEALGLTFAKKLPKKGLSTLAKDMYPSEWLGDGGRKLGSETISALGGFPVVGIHGKKLDDEGAVGTLGLIVPNKVDGFAITPDKQPPAKVEKTDKFERSKLLGGNAPTDTPFDDAAPTGGLLVGVEVHLGKFVQNDVIAGVKPVFLTGDKATEGERYGKQSDRVVRAVAKPGYAVGAITVKAGLGLDGFSVTFMKLTAGKLDPKDAYESDWLGGPGGGGKTKIGGDGTPVLGLTGRVNREGHVSAIGLLNPATTKAP